MGASVGRPKTPTRERILRNIDITQNKCWNWNKALFRDGYGQMQEEGKSQRAHRVSFKEFKGSVPEGMQVCHKCDNPKCVNPEHLFLGTNKDNMEDRDGKGRGPQGMGNGNRKLDDSKVSVIRTLRMAGYPQVRVAEFFNVSVVTVSRAHRRNSWGCVDDVMGNLQWLKDTLGRTKYREVNKTYQGINQAIDWIEKNDLGGALREEVINTWEEIEGMFKQERKPKQR